MTTMTNTVSNHLRQCELFRDAACFDQRQKLRLAEFTAATTRSINALARLRQAVNKDQAIARRHMFSHALIALVLLQTGGRLT